MRKATIQRILLLLALLPVASILTIACFGGEKVVKIGAAVSTTGRYSEEGNHTREGYMLWLDWVNEEYGGIKVGRDRYKVELVMYDDGSDPETAATLIERLIDVDEVDFLLGPYSSTLTQAAIEVAEERGVIMVEGNGASDTLFEQSFENLFAVLTPAGMYTQSALQALTDKGAESVAIAYADAAGTRSVAEGAEQWAEQHGMEVLAARPYPQDVTDVSGIVASFKALNPDVFLGAGYFKDTVLFVQAAKRQGFNPRAMIMTVGPTDPGLITDVGTDADYVIGPTQWQASMSYEGEYMGSASDYAERYTEKWGGPPVYQSASATAAALALHKAIEEAGSVDIDEVRAALRGLELDTFYGPIRFDATGKNTAKPMGAVQIQNGEILVVAPDNAAVADMMYPAPVWQDR